MFGHALSELPVARSVAVAAKGNVPADQHQEPALVEFDRLEAGLEVTVAAMARVGKRCHSSFNIM